MIQSESRAKCRRSGHTAACGVRVIEPTLQCPCCRLGKFLCSSGGPIWRCACMGRTPESAPTKYLWKNQKVQVVSLVCYVCNWARYQWGLLTLGLDLTFCYKKKCNLDLTAKACFYLWFLYLDTKSWISISGKLDSSDKQKNNSEVNEIHSGATKDDLVSLACADVNGAGGENLPCSISHRVLTAPFMRSLKYSGICFLA